MDDLAVTYRHVSTAVEEQAGGAAALLPASHASVVAAMSKLGVVYCDIGTCSYAAVPCTPTQARCCGWS